MERNRISSRWLLAAALVALMPLVAFASPKPKGGDLGEGVLQGSASPTTVVSPADPQPPPPDNDGDGVPIPEDCNDNNPNIHPAYPPNSIPAATELCNGLDDNCNGQADETFPTLGDTCTAGVGDCSGTGSIVCNMAHTGVTCTALPQPNGTACGSGSTTACTNPDTCFGGVCNANDNPSGTACASDGNDCTSDVCDGAGACTHPFVPAGSACGSASDTECDNPDTCNATGGCLANNEPPTLGCSSDGNPCTNDLCNGSGSCGHPAAAAGTTCGSPSDTDCDNPDSCDGFGACASNNEPSGTGCTTDGNDCTNDICNGTGSCTHPNQPSGFACGSQSDTDCDNPNTCNGSGSCQANNEPSGFACTTDGIQCTNDICNGTGSCTHPNQPSGFPCGNAADTICTDPDTCNGSGACQANNAADGTACNDGNVCTTLDACSGGLCGGGPALNCDDSDACTTDSCAPAPGPNCGPLPAGQCPTGATQFCAPGPLDPNSSAQAKLACEACWGTTCYLENADCAGPGWGPNPPGFYQCGNAYFGFTNGCSGGPGRSWAICSSFTTYNVWATPLGGGGCVHDPACGLTGHVWYEKVVAGADALDTAKPVKNATVGKSGAQVGSTTTNATGAYSFASLAGNLTFKPTKLVTLPQNTPNDWDLYLNGADASKIAQFAVGSTTLTVDQKEAADVSDNGFVTSFDASQVAQKVVNQAFVFTVRSNTGSDFAFFPISVSYTPMTGSQVADFGSILYGDVTENWVSPEAFDAIEPPGRMIVSQSLANMGPLTVAGLEPPAPQPQAVSATAFAPPKPAVLYLARVKKADDGHFEAVFGLMNSDGILGLDLRMTFDPSQVTILGIGTSDIATSFNSASNVVGGDLSIGLYGVNAMKGSGDFLVVRYNAAPSVNGLPFTVGAEANEGAIGLRWSSTIPRSGPAAGFDAQGE